MSRLILFGTLVFTLIFSSCKEPVRLDKSKLDTAYFVGKYQTNYMREKETITLKEDGFYDYQLDGKLQDTVIKNVGKWNFEKEKYLYVYLNDYPNVRLDKVFEEDYHGHTVNISLDVINGYGEESGDLEMLVIDGRGGEGYYTFVKQDKSKNKDYLLKTEK